MVKEDINSDKITDQDLLEEKSSLTIVTPFSKYLATVLFITLPFVGFWLGFKYWQTNSVLPEFNNNEINTQILDSKLIDFDFVDNIFYELSSSPELEYLVSDIENNNFAWRYYKDNNPITSTALITGHSIFISDLSFQDSDDEYGATVYRLDAMVKKFFTKNKFQINLFNSFSFEDSRSSQLGFRQENSNIICVRNIEDTGPEFLRYSISCGYLSENGQYEPVKVQTVEGEGVVRDNNLEDVSIGSYLTIENDKGDKIFVLYQPYQNNKPVSCLSKTGGQDFVVGDKINFKGEKVNILSGVDITTNLISTCDSEDFYLEKVSSDNNYDQRDDVLGMPECDIMSSFESRDSCYVQYAQLRKDGRLCDFVSNEDEKEICLKYSKMETETTEIEIGSPGI
ncbi:MAG: hypothetical protein R3B60_02460 [Candidatus Paceibacterota bacterium]